MSLLKWRILKGKRSLRNEKTNISNWNKRKNRDLYNSVFFLISFSMRLAVLSLLKIKEAETDGGCRRILEEEVFLSTKYERE